MEDNPGYNELPSEEVERQNEGAGEERSEKFGESLLRVMEITKEAIEKQSISKEDFFVIMDALEESPDEVEDSIGPNLGDVTKAFLDTVSKEGSWGETLDMFEQKGGLSGYLLIEMMNAGMPLDLALSEKYIQLIAGMPTLDNMSPGLLSRIYGKMATSKEGEERFKDIFISDNKTDKSMARGVYEALQGGSSLSQEQKADMELYMKMGGNLLMSTLRLRYIFAPYGGDNVSNSFEEEKQKDEKFGHDIVGVLLKEGLLSTAEASGLFETKFNTIANGTGYMATIEDAALNKIIASGFELSSDDDEIEYWINACREKRKNVLESFRTICKTGNEDVLDEYDLSDQKEIRLLAAVLANEDIYVKNLKLYSKIINRGLLDSNFFQDELVKAIAQCEERKKYEGHEDEYDSEDEENSAAVVTLALKRGLLERLNGDGLFDKYPSSRSNMIIAKVREGHFTEKDRLASISYDFDMDSYYDEDGELDNSFFRYSYDTELYMVFLDDSEKRRCCDCLLENGEYDKLAKMGEDVWDCGNISAEVRWFLSSYDRYHLDECFLGVKSYKMKNWRDTLTNLDPSLSFGMNA